MQAILTHHRAPHRIRLRLPVVLLLAAFLRPGLAKAQAGAPGWDTARAVDTTTPHLGKLIRSVKTLGQYLALDPRDPDMLYFRDKDGQVVHAALPKPEMDCFAANHIGTGINFYYDLYELLPATSDGSGVAILTRMVALLSGDDSETWAAKESADPAALARHHAQLKAERVAR